MKKEPVQQEAPEAVKDLAEADFEAMVLKGPLPAVVDFFAAEHEPSKTLAPRYGAVAEKFVGKVAFFRILKDKCPALSQKLAVTETPTLVFFKGGQEVGERLKGDAILRTALKAQTEALLK